MRPFLLAEALMSLVLEVEVGFRQTRRNQLHLQEVPIPLGPGVVDLEAPMRATLLVVLSLSLRLAKTER
jgi:hypothetical protein